MKYFIPLVLTAVLGTTVASAKDIVIEDYTNQIATDADTDTLNSLACRNFDKIVHLDISVDNWPSAKMTPPTKTASNPSGQLTIWTQGRETDAEFLFPMSSVSYQHGSYLVKGYFIVRNGGMHQGVISDAFEKIADTAVLLNPNVKEVPAKTAGCGAAVVPIPPVQVQPTPHALAPIIPGTILGSLKLSGNRLYTGGILHGKPDGTGILTYPDGQKYVGEFVDGFRQGQAVVTFADGRTFTGEYSSDARNGDGTLTMPTGERYVGHYRGGEKDGQGTSYHANGQVEYSGLWTYGKFVDTAATPEEFLATIYEWYRHGSSGTEEKSLFVAPMISLITQYRELAQRTAWPSDDTDLLCQCGDESTITSAKNNVQISVTRLGANQAVAIVNLQLTPTPRIITLHLVQIDGKWRIEDVSSNGVATTLKQRLERFVARG